MGLIARPRHPGAATSVDESSLAAFGCDLSLISDDGLPAENLLAAEIERSADPVQRRLLADIFARVRGEYDRGEMLPHPASVLAVISRSAHDLSIDLSAEQARPLLTFFDHVNRVLFQHQTLAWLAGCELKVRLYGAGWEENPAFAPIARGPTPDEPTRFMVWRASRINLALGPYGVTGERVLDGIVGGGFFLMRFCPADVIERFFPPIAAFCRSHGIDGNSELRRQATTGIKRLLTFASRTLGMNILVDWPDFVPHLLDVSASGKCESAAALWSSYPIVCFHSRDELLALCERYLYDVPARQRLADEMRRELAEANRRVRVSISRDVVGDLSPAGGKEVAA